MDELKSKVEEYLSKIDIHQQWISAYRTEKNGKFYENVFDYIIRVLNAPSNSIFLDAGCGTCAHSIRLATRGFFVQAVDFSEGVLKIAEINIKDKRLENKIKIQYEDILNLSFEDETFNYILCWGVLMHIPDLGKAISELTRVLKPGGFLIISESNMHSFHSIILRGLKQIAHKKKRIIKKTSSGIEHWGISSDGALLVRETNIKWLIERFKKEGFILRKHVAGQFTEAYTRVSSRLLKSLIHGFNYFWFRYIKIPYFAFGNILILKKEN
jgi:ubiquinone/menaquinone biosynthesis C-methylase UbiE